MLKDKESIKANKESLFVLSVETKNPDPDHIK